MQPTDCGGVENETDTETNGKQSRIFGILHSEIPKDHAEGLIRNILNEYSVKVLQVAERWVN